MKKLLVRLLLLFEAKQNKDEINGCLDIILKGRGTQDSIHILKQVTNRFESVIKERRESNIKENESIDRYFRCRALKPQNYSTAIRESL
jgi:hypothetical protein